MVINKRKIIWGTLLLFTFLLFFFWIPVGAYNKFPVIIAGIGAGLLVLIASQLMGEFKPVLIFPGVFMWIVFMMHASDNESVELKKDGIKTKGYIVDGKSVTDRQGDGSYDIKVEFKDEKGKWITVYKSVSRSEYNRYSKGQQVMLVYSKKNPTVIEVLSSAETIEEYTGVKDREIELTDLKTLLTMKKEHVDSFLNTITYSWMKTELGWVNERKYKFIRLVPEQKAVVYVSGPDEYRRFQHLMKQNDFHETDASDDGDGLQKKSFENDRLFVGLILTREKGMLLCSVTLRKKDEAALKN
jgi:hypothetical protein